MLLPGVLFQSHTDQKGARMINLIIGFVAGIITGTVLMCLLQIGRKDTRDDEEQEKYIQEWKERHGK